LDSRKLYRDLKCAALTPRKILLR